jgi:pSer/pThr/pTyr-binding forkhead associated (FHA) protein
MKLAFKFDNGKVVSHEVFERTFTIGRSDKCRVKIENEGFSREHCLIELVDGIVYVTDLESKNGIFINHIKIPPKLRISYDLKYPLYVGAAFLTLDISNDLKDPDHLSLQTFTKIDPDDLYRMPKPMKLAPKRLKPVTTEAPKKNESSFLFIASIIVLIGIAIYVGRHHK